MYKPRWGVRRCGRSAGSVVLYLKISMLRKNLVCEICRIRWSVVSAPLCCPPALCPSNG